MNNLANAFTPHSIFFLNSGNDEIRNSNFMSNFDNQIKFNQLIALNSVNNAINIYLLDNSTFNAGQANGIPGNSLVIGGAYSANGVIQNLVPSLTVAHEMGHCLGGYHTFETINGAELVNRTNCQTAGDLICDTEAESPNYNFTENATCNWTRNFTDSNGQTYSPSLNNIMDYIRPSCMQLFTTGQGARMRSVLASSSIFDNIIVDPVLNVASLICTTGQLTVNNQPAGTTVSWSSSNPSGLSINANGLATRVNGFNGQVTVTATINSGCGSVTLPGLNVWVGNPGADNSTLIYLGTRGVNPVSTSPASTYYFQVDAVPSAANYTWVLPSGFSTLGPSNTTTTPSIYITTSSTNGTYTLYCQAKNACGFSYTKSLSIVNGTTGGGGGCKTCPKPLSVGATAPMEQPQTFSYVAYSNAIVYPNPASKTLNVQLAKAQEGTVQNLDSPVVLTLYNTGQKVAYQITTTDVQVSIPLDDIPTGDYFLIISYKQQVDQKRVRITK